MPITAGRVGGLDFRLAQQVLWILLAARLVREIAGAELAYAPARPTPLEQVRKNCGRKNGVRTRLACRG